MRSRDDPVSWSSIATAPEEVEEGEEVVPVEAEFIDERPDAVKLVEEFPTNSKWKLLGDQNEDSQSWDILGPAKSAMRWQRHDCPEPSAPGGKHNGSLELCAPRRQRPGTPEPSPPRRQSPGTPEPSPPRRQRPGTPEPSPPRRRRPGTPEPSPPRRRRPGTPEPSPPRRRRPGTPEPSPPRQQQRHDTPEPSPPRWQRQDLSPQREKWGSPRGNRSRRKGRTLPAGKAQHRSRSPLEHCPHHWDAEASPKKAQTRSSRIKAGLLSADVWQREKQELRRHERSTKQLEEESQNAQTVFRDKLGRKRNLAQEQLEQRLKAEAEAKREQQYARWGKGLAQERLQQQQNVEDAIKEMQKPLARYIDDEDLDRMLREQEREGDPMAALIKKRKAKEKKEKEKPRYKGPAPPLNRFNIWPGHRWDGVDRSNGLEQQRSARSANVKAMQDLAHKWSTQDM